MIRKILVATDFSETSEGALRWGLEIARAHDAAVHVIHALRLPSLATPYVPVPPDVDRELEERARTRLAEVEKQVAGGGLTVTTEIRSDDPVYAIPAAAEEVGADLVVLGTRGLTGLEHLLLGSVAERVLAGTSCPVLSVHPGDFDRHRPLEKILVPTDFSEEARRSAEAALELLGARRKGELLLVHAYHLPVEYAAYGAMPSSWNFLDEVAAAAKSELEEWAGTLTASGWKVTIETAEGPPAAVIERLARERAVDLIAMGTHGRSGLSGLVLGSIAKRVVQHAPCPVLTLRRRKE